MMIGGLNADERREWGLAGTIALVAHVGVGVLALTWARPAYLPIAEPVVLVELPPAAAPSSAAADPVPVAEPQAKPMADTPVVRTPPVEIPPVSAALPTDPVILPPPPPADPAPTVSESQPQVATPAVESAGESATASPGLAAGHDPKARRREADYFALISAHLNRRKTYPAEARKARQQGVVTVRFTVDRKGLVSDVAIKRSSGHKLLDQATVDLVHRVAPLPAMPASMQRDSVTLSLPIEYSLRIS